MWSGDFLRSGFSTKERGFKTSYFGNKKIKKTVNNLLYIYWKFSNLSGKLLVVKMHREYNVTDLPAINGRGVHGGARSRPCPPPP